MNRHQSMMDLSRMTPQAYPQFMGGPFMPPYGAPFGAVLGMPYGSMSYLNDPRMMPQPWGYAGERAFWISCIFICRVPSFVALTSRPSSPKCFCENFANFATLLLSKYEPHHEYKRGSPVSGTRETAPGRNTVSIGELLSTKCLLFQGSTGSFSNLNSSAEGEGKDTDSESTSRLPLRNPQNPDAAAAAAAAAVAAASMRRCQSFAANQWNNMAYPYAPPQGMRI